MSASIATAPAHPSAAHLTPERLLAVEAKADALAARYDSLEAADLLRVMIEREFPGRIAVVSSFGAESAVLLDLVAQIDPATPIVFLETGKHFDATLTYRDVLVLRLGLSDVRDIQPDAGDLAREDRDGTLWRRAADRCCHLRKVLPLERALDGFDAWITGRKRYQGFERASLPPIEAVDGRVKINPLAHWSAGQVASAMRARRLPAHPLADEGFRSIGCAPCTHAVDDNGHRRAGRWVGSEKTECGIHLAKWAK